MPTPSFPGYAPASRFEYPTTLLLVAATVALPVSLVGGLAVADLVRPGAGVEFVVTPANALPFTLSLLLALPFTLVVHELVHGVVARLLGYRVSYGFRRLSRFLYAGYAAAFAQPISRRDNALIAVAPLLVLDALAVVGFAVAPGWLALSLLTVVAVNTSGAVGDLYLCYRLLRLPHGTVLYDASAEEMYVLEPA